jgi:ATPase subunit of ABC transporter with duplicated ATPase domains
MSKNPRSDEPDFSGNTIIRFQDVSFEYGPNKPILDEINFTVRQGTKITLMGQNGAGKSTIFSLIIGTAKPESGDIFITDGVTIATAKQTIPRADLELTMREFFAKCFAEKVYDLDPRIDSILEAVNIHGPKGKGHADLKDRLVKTFSGGQQARLLLASALIQDPDILLLDEPTNNLDKAGIEHLTKFLVDYKKTCVVISHDSDFLNSFTHGVLYLDIHTRKVEQYVGDYKDVVEEISRRIEKENTENARLIKEIEAKKYQAGVFAQKGGQMRLVAKRMREKAEELEEEIVDVRKEDRTIKPFKIPSQADLIGEVVHISSYSMLDPKKHKPVERTCDISLRKRHHLLLSGPNGIGKSTLLEAIVRSQAASLAPQSGCACSIASGIRVGYYRQDFSMMDFNDTVYQSLEKIVRATQGRLVETELRAAAASFLIGADAIHTRIGALSEGQKGLVAFARLVLLKPGLLILDEPTNHINFRHLPVIAKALDQYEGAMILVSHVPEFVEQVRIDEKLEMGKQGM